MRLIIVLRCVYNELMIKKVFRNSELFIVDFNALIYLDNFLISSVTSIIAIRIYLSLTGFPQIGGEALHIAHMLWGGLLMMITLISLLAFINRQTKIIGSVVGGLGFGIFVDELGKFISHDNNYFFQPTFAIIYVLLLIIYFSFRKIFEFIEKDDKEYIMNALELLKESVYYDLDTNEKHKIINYLKLADQKHPLVTRLSSLISHIEAKPLAPEKIMARLRKNFHLAYINTLKSKHFAKLLFVILITGSFTNIYLTILNLLEFRFTFWEIGLIVSVVLATMFTVWGIIKIAEGKTTLAYLHLRRATMISILFIQFFAFYFHQLAALIPLVTAFITYLGIQSLLTTSPKKS